MQCGVEILGGGGADPEGDRVTLRVVSVSGGKDSTACAILAIERFPRDQIRFVFADTGNEHPVTVDYVTDYMPRVLGVPVTVVRGDFAERMAGKREFIKNHWADKGVPADKIERALNILHPTGNPYLDLCIWKGRFPGRKSQFCTMELKTYPIGEFQLGLIDAGFLVESWQGIRRDESQNRRNAPERESLGGGVSVYRPIVDWTAQQTVDFIRERGIRLNPLYSLGMGRVGCMPCINARKGELLEIARRFPEHIERIAEWEVLVSEASRRGAATFFPAANFVPRGTEMSDEEWGEVGNVRSAVEWAKTTRGGRQYDLIAATEDLPGCSSAYGLCE